MSNKYYAQQLYMAGGKTQKEIADLTGVSERTVYTWVHQFAWDKLRLAAYQAPATIADNICAQLVEIQNAIAQREPGKRFPTMEEAEITRKLITSLEKMKKYPSIAQHMQVLETFRNYIRPADKEFAKQLAIYTTRFLSAKTINGFAPYQLEYGVSPVDPYYEEPEDTDVIPAHKPCPNINTCLHENDCNYPKCLHTKTPAADPLITYGLPSFHFQSQTQHTDKQYTTSTLSEETGSFPAIIPTPPTNTPPEQTGSFPATIPTQTTTTPPEQTGSFPAIPPTQTNNTPPEQTGSFPAIPPTQTTHTSPEQTGSFPAIPPTQTTTTPPEQTGSFPAIPPTQTTTTPPEQTGSFPAIPPTQTTTTPPKKILRHYRHN